MTSTSGVRAACRLALGLAVATLVPALAAAQPDGLASIPRPILDNLEGPVREQLLAERESMDAELERHLESGGDGAELAMAYGSLGRLYYLNDFTEAASRCFENAIELTPDVFEWRYFLGALFPVEGKLEEAEALLISALELRPDYVPAWIRLGRAQLDLGRVEDAAESFSEAAELVPESAAAHKGLGRVAFERGRFEEAIRYFEHALELQPEATQIHYQLGLAYRELGDRERALEHLKLNRHQDVRVDDPLVNNLYQIVRSAKLHFNSAIDLLEMNQTEAAIEQLRIAIEQQPDQFTYHHNLAAALGLIGQEEEAIVAYRRTLELNPEYPNAHFNLAMMLAERGQLEEAAQHLELAHRFDPEDLVAHTEWATALSQLGESERAAAELGKVLDRDPTYGKALLNLATVQAQSGRSAAAEATLAQLLEGDADDSERASGNFRLGRIYEERRDPARAVAAYRTALEFDGDSLEAHRALAGVLARGQRFLEAAEHFGRVVELESGDPSPHYGRGLALILGGRDLEAREMLDRSVEEHGDHLPLVHLLARVLATAPDAAARDGSRALELAQRVFSQQQTLEHAETIAMALAELGRFEEATQWQRDIVGRAEGAPQGMKAALERRLAQYERGEPVRAPWRG